MDAFSTEFSLREHVPLAPYTTFGVGGAARWFAAVASEGELDAACVWAAANGLELFVLGGGSNVLVADAGFDGLVVQVRLRGVQEREEQGRRMFTVAAGESWDELVARTVEAGCAGMECLAGIPGSVGGTPVQNVGAYGQEVAQTITRVRCYDRQSAGFVSFAGEACGFAYRTSRFNAKPDQGRYIVTAVEFALVPGGAPSLGYADLQRQFAGRAGAPSLAETAEAVRSIRKGKGMLIEEAPLDGRDPDTRSAGSFFKNPVVAEAVYAAIAASVAPVAVPSYPAPGRTGGDARRKLPAAWLLEQAGFGKGFQLGGAAVSSKHTLALTNRSGHATAAEILALRDLLAEGVYRRFGVALEAEPVLVGATPV